ncbi:MAG: rhomboid family intramembrane serine protease [Gelidibacter sp.]
MDDQHQFKYSTSVIAYPTALIMLIWIVFWVQVRFVPEIKSFGIFPQTWKGLRGILFSPFIHGDIEHIYHNTIPLFILTMALFYFYRAIAWKILLYGILVSGLITWVIGRPANHIGASSLIYVLVSFIFFKGLLARHYRLIALSLIVIFLYGSMIWYVFPVKENISWEGHLGGLIAGILFAFVFRKTIVKPEKYIWQQPDYKEEDDPFLKHFDKDGNFIEYVEPKIENEPELDTESKEPIKITYHFKNKND